MARIKYGPGITPAINEHAGYTFQPNRYGQSILSLQKNNRTRYSNQKEQQQNLMKATRFWRDMPAEVKNNWNTFAATYPQASRRDPAIFLTGFQLFCKRCHYCFLNHGITTNFMEQPVAEILPAPVFYLTVENTENVIDVTELYIKNFGLLPLPGQFLLCRVFPMAEFSGQFFVPFETVLTVQAVYIDGMFVSFSFATPTPGLTYSLYLSKPVNAGQQYVGTKVRYMGCFTPKSFLQLTDTPDSYAGESGKTVIVKEDETGLEFGAGGGGGLTCETLVDCPTIQNINSILNSILTAVVPIVNSSIPPVKFGLLYNRNAAANLNLSSDANWILPTYYDVINLYTYLGGKTVASPPLKDTDPSTWLSVVGNTNIKSFNGRGSGERTGGGGACTSLKDRLKMFTSTIYFGSGVYYWELKSGTTSIVTGGLNLYNTGYAVRFVKLATGKADGTTGVYIGNNGRAYRTIVINQLEWLADNLAETIMADGSEFPEITDNLEWAANSLQAYCAYNNDWSNV